MLISIIIPVYNEEDTLDALFDLLTEFIPQWKAQYDYELIFIEDGSTDRTFERLREKARTLRDTPVRIVRMARNFGTHIGLMAAINYCRGDAAIYIAADLQCPLETIPRLATKFLEGCDVVWGVRIARKDPLLSRITAKAYYALMRLLMHREMRFHNVETFLISRKVIEQLKRFREKNSNLLILIESLGFKSSSMPVGRLERIAGSSKWSLLKKLKLFIDSLVSFSYLPIRFFSFMGILISLAGFGMAGLQIYQKLIGLNKPTGWTFLVVIILLLSGFQMLMLGLLGEYVWRILDQVNSRPLYIVDQIEDFDGNVRET